MPKSRVTPRLVHRLKAIAAAVGLAACATPLLAAEHQLTKINYDATRNVNVMDVVLSIDWDIDAPPAGRDKAFIETIVRQSSQSLFTMTEGRQMLGKVYIYKNSQFMDNTDIQYLIKDGRANAAINGFTTRKAARVQMFAGSGETTEVHGKVVAHEYGHYMLGLFDEYREAGKVSTDPTDPMDGDTPRDTIMHDHTKFPTLSTADDYADPEQRKTAQYRGFKGKSAWEAITVASTADDLPEWSGRILYAPFKNMPAPSKAALTKPTTGWENDLQIVYMGAETTAAPAAMGSGASSRAAATPVATGPINVIVIDTTTSAANLAAQLNAAAQMIDAMGKANRVAVYAHPYSNAAIVPMTSLASDANRASVKQAIAKIAADASTDEKTNGERIFAWAEGLLPSLFPAGAATQSIPGWNYRLYSTGKAVGVSGGKLYYFDGAALADLGVMTQWLNQARNTLTGSLQKSLAAIKAVRTLADTPSVTVFTTSTQTVDNSLIAAMRDANVAVSPVALKLADAASKPRLRTTVAGQTSLFDLAKGTHGTFKEASKASELSNAAGKAANAAEGDDTQSVNSADAEALAAGATHTVTSTIAGDGLDKQAVFQAFWDDADDGKLAFTLKAPNGTVITPSSLPAGITYSAPAGEGEASYTVASTYAHFAGSWTSTLTASAATDTVSQEVNVSSTLSAIVDILGGTAEDKSLMRASLEVSGPVAVTGAAVTADVVSLSTGKTVKSGLLLKDDGVAPDEKKSDGKYAVSLADLPADEYEITVKVTNNGSATYTTAGNTKMGPNLPPQTVPAFQRVAVENFVKN